MRSHFFCVEFWLTMNDLFRIFLQAIFLTELIPAVRYGRVPKRSRERAEEAHVSSSDDQAARELETKQLAMYDIILTISQAHHAHCGFTEEKTRGLIRKPALLVSGNRTLAPVSLDDTASIEFRRVN